MSLNGKLIYDGEEDLHIPFFARVALKNACRRLESIGYTDIRLAKISVDEDYKHLIKLKKAKAKKLVWLEAASTRLPRPSAPLPSLPWSGGAIVPEWLLERPRCHPALLYEACKV